MKSDNPPRLALYFLGAPRLELAGEPVSLSHHKALALLAYLAVTRQPHTRQALATLLWPDYEPGAARGELRRLLWVLNKQKDNRKNRNWLSALWASTVWPRSLKGAAVSGLPLW